MLGSSETLYWDVRRNQGDTCQEIAQNFISHQIKINGIEYEVRDDGVHIVPQDPDQYNSRGEYAPDAWAQLLIVPYDVLRTDGASAVQNATSRVSRTVAQDREIDRLNLFV